jgi:hemerythrin
MALRWTPDLTVGVDLVDDQHKRLFSEVDKLVTAVNQKDFAVVGKTFDFLAGYAVEHFASEERLMREANYPGIDAHLSQHHAFVKDFVALKTTYERDGATVVVVLKLNNWLFSWLWNHVRGSDVVMGKHFVTHKGTSSRASIPAAR